LEDSSDYLRFPGIDSQSHAAPFSATLSYPNNGLRVETLQCAALQTAVRFLGGSLM
jgi:hypothetical protein